MKGHWNQIGQHATCLTKHKYKSKNQIISYQQVQHGDLIGLQIPLQSAFKILFQHPQSHKKHIFSILNTLYNHHT
jgi:hypothetical protein